MPKEQWDTYDEFRFLKHLGTHQIRLGPHSPGSQRKVTDTDQLSMWRAYRAGMASRTHWGKIDPAHLRVLLDKLIQATETRR